MSLLREYRTFNAKTPTEVEGVVFKHTCQNPSPSSAFRAFYCHTEEKTKYYLYSVLLKLDLVISLLLLG